MNVNPPASRGELRALQFAVAVYVFMFAIKQFVFSSALACYLSAATDSDSGDGDPDVLLQIGRCWKGMGNYETLSELPIRGKIAYCLMAKCQPIADSLRVPLNSYVAMLQ